jgi:hypothetical protein
MSGIRPRRRLFRLGGAGRLASVRLCAELTCGTFYFRSDPKTGRDEKAQAPMETAASMSSRQAAAFKANCRWQTAAILSQIAA